MKTLTQPTGVPHVHLLDGGLKSVPEYTGVYVLDTDTPAVVETAFSYSVPRILQGLDELGIAPADVGYIIPTHIHMDHAGGAGSLVQACPNARVLVQDKVAKHLVDPTRLVESVRRAVGTLFDRYGEMVPIPKARLMPVRGGECLTLAEDFSLRVIHAPGHAPHQFCLFVPEHHALFAADACGIHRHAMGQLTPTTPPPAFFLGESLETLSQLKQLNPKTLLYTHYGAFDADGLIDAYADLLSQWVAEVEEVYNVIPDEAAVQKHFVKKYSPVQSAHYDPAMVKQEIEMNTMGVLLYLKRQREG